jgi:DNA-binding LacI/PurR family transcriptional regulator/DNA-binding transcriptional regulator YhcF (GntR family)
MDKTGTRPAIQKAVDFIRDNLSRQVWQPGERLPPVRVLAIKAGVSTFTMVKAMAHLKTEGLVSGIERGPTRAGNGVKSNATHPELSHAAWQLKRTDLERNILEGMYSEKGRLPTIKELQARYGTSYRTMRKILLTMVADGVLSLRGKAWELHGNSQRSSHKYFIFLSYPILIAPQTAINQGQNRLFELLEQECIRRNITMKMVEFDAFKGEESKREFSDSSPLLGYIMDIWDTSETAVRTYAEILNRLSRTKIPVAILDEIGDFVLPLQFVSNPMMQVFTIERKKAGSRIARFLLGRGHRSAVFISSRHQTLWSKQRWEGVVEQYSLAGCSAGIHSVLAQDIEMNQNDMLAVSGFSEALIKDIFSLGLSRNAVNDIYRSFQQYKENNSPKRFSPKDIKEVQRKIGVIGDLAQHNPSQTLSRIVRTAVFRDVGEFGNFGILATLFEKALAFDDASAWICACDDIAFQALTFLRKAKIKVPRDISVIGFDNEPGKALENQLTTFDFNALGFVHHMLNFIARPHRPWGGYKHSAVEVEGMIIERGTTGKKGRFKNKIKIW